ncbi:hypothetical protein CHU98_g11987 [Xylaria longipes]|nr:hypothetical protein CHU98_g11987 [Xylaria longipes]
MSTASFTIFSRLPTNIQQKIWEYASGSLIHVLRPAPADIFHWAQDFACPIYQAIDAGTNKPLEDVPLNCPAPISSCTFARNVLRQKLMDADLSLFDPDVLQLGGDIPSKFAEKAYITNALQRTKRMIQIFTEHSLFADIINILLCNAELEVLLIRPLPGTVLYRFQWHATNVRRCLRRLRHYLEFYEAEEAKAHEKQKHYEAAHRYGLQLEQDVKRANRGLANYAMPGWIDPYLPRVATFRQAEAQRARQKFAIAPKQDLVYLTDPQHPELFVRL